MLGGGERRLPLVELGQRRLHPPLCLLQARPLGRQRLAQLAKLGLAIRHLLLSGFHRFLHRLELRRLLGRLLAELVALRREELLGRFQRLTLFTELLLHAGQLRSRTVAIRFPAFALVGQLRLPTTHRVLSRRMLGAEFLLSRFKVLLRLLELLGAFRQRRLARCRALVELPGRPRQTPLAGGHVGHPIVERRLQVLQTLAPSLEFTLALGQPGFHLLAACTQRLLLRGQLLARAVTLRLERFPG